MYTIGQSGMGLELNSTAAEYTDLTTAWQVLAETLHPVVSFIAAAVSSKLSPVL